MQNEQLELGLDPGEVLPEKAVFKPLDVKKLFKKSPGNIHWAPPSHTAIGCAVIEFRDAEAPTLTSPAEVERFRQECGGDFSKLSAPEQVNIYFAHRANLVVVNMLTTYDKILCLVTTMVDEDELEELDHAQHAMMRTLEKFRAEREERRQKETAEKEAAEKQAKEDAELGKTVREHRIIERLKEVEAELKTVRAQRNKMAKKLGVKVDE